MKSAVLLLILAFGAAQGVSFTDCPCGSLCETKNACPDEKKHNSSDDCCSRSRETNRQASENCFHLEPQTDVDRTSTEAAPVPVLILAVLDLPVLIVPVVEERSVRSSHGLSPPSNDAPLFLLHSTLLI